MRESLADIAARYNTDKSLHRHYLESYERYFGPLRDSDIRLLELGIKDGGSLLMWRDYFPSGVIAGLDINPAAVDDSTGRVRTFQGPQQDAEVLDRAAAECTSDGFDIIIDDCSHIGVLARESFRHLFNNQLKSGGWYVIEDWGTAYWPSWVDGAEYSSKEKRFSTPLYRATRGMNRLAQLQIPIMGGLAQALKKLLIRRQFNHHDFGMVGFVKELIDELAAGDRTHERFGVGPHRLSSIAEMHLFHAHAFIRKA
jgi:hypothetical protein